MSFLYNICIDMIISVSCIDIFLCSHSRSRSCSRSFGDVPFGILYPNPCPCPFGSFRSRFVPHLFFQCQAIVGSGFCQRMLDVHHEFGDLVIHFTLVGFCIVVCSG